MSDDSLSSTYLISMHDRDRRVKVGTTTDRRSRQESTNDIECTAHQATSTSGDAEEDILATVPVLLNFECATGIVCGISIEQRIRRERFARRAEFRPEPANRSYSPEGHRSLTSVYIRT